MSSLLSLLILVCIHILDTAAHYDCEWTTPNATYNLCEMQLSSDSANNKTYYEVFDTRDYVYYNYTYVFNVCNDIESKPPDEICWNNTLRELQLMPIGYCQQEDINQTDGECIESTPINRSTAAYQIHRGMDTEGIVHDCYRMHNGIDKPIFSYLDPNDPSIGVRLTYINGDWCDLVNKNREFSLEFICSEMLQNIPDKKEEEIEETEICSYVLQIETSYGCPVQCPISQSNNRLCDGHGICAFDNTNNKPRCYCYYGYCGNDCSQTGTACNENNNLLYNVTAPNDDESCLFELRDFYGIKAYYNLSYFNLNDENFVVDDKDDREYVYKFNICGDIENFDDETVIPSSCTNYNHGPCTHFTEYSWTISNETETTKSCENDYDTFDSGSVAKAVQIFYPKENKSEPMCYWLGMDLPNGFNMPSYAVSLLDKNDSGRGIQFKILNGQYCAEGARNRELNIKLTCPDTLIFEFDPYDEAKHILNESIYESVDEKCIYTIELESPLACPMQCISKGYDPKIIDPNRKKTFSVCDNHGICLSDPEAQQIRCICNDGWTGIDCSVQISDITTTQSGGSTTTANGGGGSTTSNGESGNDGGGGGGNGVGVGLGVGIAILVIIVLGFFCYTQRKKRLMVGLLQNLQYGQLQESGGNEAINAVSIEAGQ